MHLETSRKLSALADINCTLITRQELKLNSKVTSQNITADKCSLSFRNQFLSSTRDMFTQNSYTLLLHSLWKEESLSMKTILEIGKQDLKIVEIFSYTLATSYTD